MRHDLISLPDDARPAKVVRVHRLDFGSMGTEHVAAELAAAEGRRASWQEVEALRRGPAAADLDAAPEAPAPCDADAEEEPQPGAVDRLDRLLTRALVAIVGLWCGLVLGWFGWMVAKALRLAAEAAAGGPTW